MTGDSGTWGWWRRWDIEVVSCILLVWMFDGDTTTSKNAGTDAVGNGIFPQRSALGDEDIATTCTHRCKT